jgi:murein DD-endopeptidase MepM/ murein hydrolase activator NlpD
MRMRSLVPALAALALAPGGLAFAESADRASPEPASRPPALVPITPLRAVPPLLRDGLDPSSPVHPVRAPVDYGEAGAAYGADRGGRMHEGQDVFAPAGTPLVAVRGGVVLETGNDGGRGNYVGIWNPAVRETYVYLHLLEPAAVQPGERVRPGQQVGRLGCTGSCFGDHLHFEVRRGKTLEGVPRDPLPLLRRLPRA